MCKESPKVLLLYSYDCAAHEEVVKKFANYLKAPGKPSSFSKPCETFVKEK